MKTYILHYTKLKERKQFILDQLNKVGIIDFEFIEDYDKENLNKKIIDNYYCSDVDGFNKVAKITKDHCGGGEYRILKDSEISLMIKHIKALEKISSSNHEYGLILEDDCLFHENAYKKTLDDILIECPSDFDVLVIGGAFDHSICKYKSIIKNKFLLSDHPATNTTSSMIFKKTTAIKILESFNKFHLSWDWQLNYIFYKLNLNIYHTIPYVCTQAKYFKTSIQN